VRQAALEALKSWLEALASASGAEALPILRELAKAQESLIGETAMKVLMSFSQPAAISVLQELTLVPDAQVVVQAISRLGSLCSREELEVFLNLHDQQLSADALTSLDWSSTV
jgi:HEAT repeats